MQWIQENNAFLEKIGGFFFHFNKNTLRQSKEKLQYTNSIISEVVVWCILLLINLALHLIETIFRFSCSC